MVDRNSTEYNKSYQDPNMFPISGIDNYHDKCHIIINFFRYSMKAVVLNSFSE